MFGKIKKFLPSDVRNYEKCFSILEELKACPRLQEMLFQKRESYLKKLFSLKGEEKSQLEGRIMELNDILNTKENLASHISTFRQIAKESEQDIDSLLEYYQDHK